MATGKYPKKFQAGLLEGYFTLAAIVGTIAAFGGTYWLGGHNREAAITAKYEQEKAAAIVAADKKRSENLEAFGNLIRNQLDAEAKIAELSAQVKGKISNETSKNCPSAPAGSVLVTPDRLRDLKAIYNRR